MANHFQHIDGAIDQNSTSGYLILSSNINSDDTWIWKFSVNKFNFTPVWSNEYGDCVIEAADLPEAMESANKWASGSHRSGKIILYLLKFDL